jgi:DNA-binding response OmpR family regulator
MNPAAEPKHQFLVVDDDIHLNTTFALMLEFPGYEVRTVHSGEVALALLAKARFDLIITEHWVSGMQGDELAAIVKQQWPGLPIIMLTADFEEMQRHVDPLAGVDCHLSKPVSMSQLREAVMRVLDRYAGIRESSRRAHGTKNGQIEEPAKSRKTPRPRGSHNL